MKKALYFLFLIFISSCGNNYSDAETKFFKKLEADCNCEVSREYDEKATKDFKGGPGWYKLILTCEDDKLDDDLEEFCGIAAQELHDEVLKDVDYPYNEIKVEVIMNAGQPFENGTIKYFHYNNHDRFYLF